MAYRKRKIEDFDPNKSDSDDLDYGAEASSPPAQRKRSRKSKGASSSSTRKPPKRRRERYGDSEDDIEVDSDDHGSEEDSFAESSQGEDEEGAEEEELNPRTGRRVRASAKKPVKYEESDEEDEGGEDIEDSDDDIIDDKHEEGEGEEEESKHTKTKLSKRSSSKTSLLVRLKVPPSYMDEDAKIRRMRPSAAGGARSTRTTTTAKREPTPQMSRRSSRISHDEQLPLVALTDSGRHELVTRAGTATPEPQQQQQQSSRAQRGSKGLKKPPPSAIMEVSQEDDPSAPQTQQQQQQEAGGEEDFMRSLHEAAQGENEGENAAVESAAEGEHIQMETTNDHDDEEDESGGNVIQESMEDEDDAPIARAGRSTRLLRRRASTPPLSQPSEAAGPSTKTRTLRSRKPTSAAEPSSDFEPDEGEGEGDGEDEMSDSADDRLLKPPTARSSNDESAGSRRSGRLTRKNASRRSRSRRHSKSEEDDELDPEEIADEAADLEEDNRRNRRERRRPATRRGGLEQQQPQQPEIAYEPNLRTRGSKKPDYRIIRPELLFPVDDDDDGAAVPPAATPSRRGRGGGAGYRSLFSTYGPFGGASIAPPVFGHSAIGATGGVESDSSDDEAAARGAAVGGGGGQPGIGGAVGMTPTSAFPKPFAPPPASSAAQAHGNDPIQGAGGGPPNLGKVKDKKALADADPLGVDPHVNFDGVGGLDDHIDRLKEMVALPLLYPEVFTRFHVTPPRGVLFHGPPGTGKTLLARALASNVSSGGKKVTFYMRKGADALSKWVGEAEKQLRLLFEEARKNQPSIIFFDEIDGLAPVRSSKQEQIHASIVATLLALMDGMDGRGQVIVIGATNRPDSVDPALRRPGRFDREFYFPLPDQAARRAIIDIHTKGWDPPLKPAFKTHLAELTRGYGGADLRALCTEAALNAVQGTFPQIYKSQQKLVIDPSKIRVLAKDFMISVNKIVPSSERSVASGAAPLKKEILPLLRAPLEEVVGLVENALPRKRKRTALEEAMYDDREELEGDAADGDGDVGFERENLQRMFESSRVFRPRLLIKGREGMGQRYLGAALLSKLEGMHVQHFDMATLMKDSTRSVEAAIVQQFEEVKRHKPSVIFIPNIDVWYRTLGESAIRTFTGLLKSLPPTEPVLLLGILEESEDEADLDDESRRIMKRMLRDLFGYSLKDLYELQRPDEAARLEYFEAMVNHIRKSPTEFPDDGNRKRRKLEDLPVAPPDPAAPGPTKADLKAQKRKDRQTLNLLKLHIQPVMDQIKLKYKKFRLPTVEDREIAYLYDEIDPGVLTTDLTEEQRQQQQQLHRPWELDVDDKGVQGIREAATGRFCYNLQIVTIEQRLSNGYYKRPADFLADIKRLQKDAVNFGDPDRQIKGKEMLANVDVDMATLESAQPALVAECQAVYERELARERELQAKAEEAARQRGAGGDVPRITANVPPPGASKTTSDEASGPIVLGQEIPGTRPLAFPPVTPSRPGGFGIGMARGENWTTTATATTNGESSSHHTTNGSTVPSRGHGEDVEMQDASPENAAAEAGSRQQQQQAQLHQQATSPTSQMTQAQQQQPFSQKSAHTRVAQNSQLDQYQNSASTTTSGQKTGGSGGSGGDRQQQNSNSNSNPHSVNTQATNGFREHHASAAAGGAGTTTSGFSYFSGIPDAHDVSPIPDTQLSQASSSQHHAQQQQQRMGPPPPLLTRETSSFVGGGAGFAVPTPAPSTAPAPSTTMATTTTTAAATAIPATAPPQAPQSSPSHQRRGSNITALLNDDDGEADQEEPHQLPTAEPTEQLHEQQPSTPSIVLDENHLLAFQHELATRSSGLSVEQLEQVSAAMMSALWKKRGDWNRNRVLSDVKDAFNQVVLDVERTQSVLGPSQKTRAAGGGAGGEGNGGGGSAHGVRGFMEGFGGETESFHR